MIYVYGRPDCTFCDQAKELLDETGLDYQYIDIKEHTAARDMMRMRGHATVPQVYNGDISIGGYTDMKAWLKRMYPSQVTLVGEIRI